MLDAKFNDLDPKNRLGDDELDTVAGGMSDAEAREAVNKILDGFESEGDGESDDPWQDGFGRARGGRLGGFK